MSGVTHAVNLQGQPTTQLWSGENSYTPPAPAGDNILIDESGNQLVDESGNLLVSP